MASFTITTITREGRARFAAKHRGQVQGAALPVLHGKPEPIPHLRWRQRC
jgi:hypothetical protein